MGYVEAILLVEIQPTEQENGCCPSLEGEHEMLTH